ncbi:mechanosensitive ion channel family protein [Pseudoalteromonas denitrificans]|nr:mechanosensitive ion channel domain-containing protein [Pseudoalteromonas denitrificans]
MEMSPLQTLILSWLDNMPEANFVSAMLAVISGICLLVIVYLLANRFILPTLQKVALYFSPKTIRPLGHLINKLDRRLSILFSVIVFLTSFHFIYPVTEILASLFKSGGQIVLVIYAGLIFSSVVSIAGAIYNQLSFSKDVPIQGLIQVIKLITFIIVAILVFSVMINKTPTYILSGFGALAAVLLLVFKDTILGFVASIQIAANRLVTYGDWIEVKRFGADGEVEELGLNTVKVRNWDNTITTIPTYALISDSFKNWRGMAESGGRRIKRSLNIDMLSIKIVSESLQNRLIKNETLQAFLLKNVSPLEGQTNIGLFRQYAEFYLKQHVSLNQSLTLMVRELQPTQYGLPLEFYCFSQDKRWIPYEHLQGDIIDHFLAMLPVFDLRPYQSISGEFKAI